MDSLVKPQGVCFIFESDLPAHNLSNVLCKIANFLQGSVPFIKLRKFDDWWEHDGLHFYRGLIEFDALYRMINSSKNLLESTPSDDFVFVGVAPIDNSWYLRYRVEWNDEETNLVGSCAVILPQPLAEKFRVEVLKSLDVETEERHSEIYYQEIIL